MKLGEVVTKETFERNYILPTFFSLRNEQMTITSGPIRAAEASVSQSGKCTQHDDNHSKQYCSQHQLFHYNHSLADTGEF